MNVETHSTNPLAAAIALGGVAPLAMTSREIADRTGKQHKNVIRDVRAMLAGLHGQERVDAMIGDGSDLSHLGNRPEMPGVAWERDSRGYLSVFSLDKAHTLTLVSGYEPRLRKAIVDRWMELEQRASDPNAAILRALSDPAAMRGLLLGYTERVIALEDQVAEMAPQVQALERIAVADGSLCVTDAAKTLQVRPKDLFTYLRTHGWIYRRAGSDTDVAYQGKIVSGFLEHKTETVLRGDGSEKVQTQVRVTPKGLAALGKLLPPVATAA